MLFRRVKVPDGETNHVAIFESCVREEELSALIYPVDELTVEVVERRLIPAQRSRRRTEAHHTEGHGRYTLELVRRVHPIRK
jgi:hypothetical protein